MDRTFQHGETTLRVTARVDGETLHTTSGDTEHAYAWERIGPGDYLIRENGKLRRCVVARRGDERWVWIDGHVHTLRVVSGGRRAARTGGGLAAPMPGQVLEVLTLAGDHVTKGQRLLILEAMKMQCDVQAPRDGVVETVHVAAGDQVAGGQVLVALAEEPP